jgi:hypothetical protein
MKRLISSILFAAFSFLTLSAEECGTTHLIEDSGFDLWCDDQLCSWDVEMGEVVQAPSWHKADYSAEFVGESVVISQVSTGEVTTCIRFEVLADIDDNARMFLAMDFFDDGVIDYEQELGHVKWERLVHLVAVPATWDSVRFTLRKDGPGRARLAQIEATTDTACVGEPLDIEDNN